MPDTMIQTMPSPVTIGMPVEIAKAIVQVMAGVGKLCKGERNGHDGYNFVSVDGFLSAVNPLCAEAGLVIIQDEESVDFVEKHGRNGTSTWLRVTYSFTVAHVSGAVMPRAPRRTVMTIANGAQAFGSAQSYALKQFMRTLFQISTGDKDDPDFQQTQDMGSTSPPPQRPAQRAEPPRRPAAPPKPPQATPSESGEPVALEMPWGPEGPLIGRWINAAKEALAEKPEAWRRAWMEMNMQNIDDIRRQRPDWADKLVAMIVSPDPAPIPELPAIAAE